MTSELVSTEAAIVEADKHSIYPGAFLNNKKFRPSVKNAHNEVGFYFSSYFFPHLFTSIQIGGTGLGVQ